MSFGTAGCNLACSSARTGISPSRGRPTHSPIRAHRPDRHRTGAADELGCEGAFTYNDRQASGSTRRTRRGRRHERGIKGDLGDGRVHVPTPACRVISAHRRGPHVDLKGSPHEFITGLRRAYGRIVLDTLGYCGTKPTCGWRSPPCSFPGTTTATPKSHGECPGSGRHWGLPLQFTGFPRYKNDGPSRRPTETRPGPPIALGRRIAFRLTGNVHDAEGRGSTVLPGCGDTVVVRIGTRCRHYELTDDGVEKGREPAARCLRRPVGCWEYCTAATPGNADSDEPPGLAHSLQQMPPWRRAIAPHQARRPNHAVYDGRHIGA